MEDTTEKRDIEQLIDDRLPKSAEILERAKKVLLSPTVTGPFRAPRGVAFIKEAKGSKVVDVDGNEYGFWVTVIRWPWKRYKRPAPTGQSTT
jgi:hypothetical protein